MLIVRRLMNNKQILSQASLVEGLYIRMNSGGDRKSRTVPEGGTYWLEARTLRLNHLNSDNFCHL